MLGAGSARLDRRKCREYIEQRLPLTMFVSVGVFRFVVQVLDINVEEVLMCE